MRQLGHDITPIILNDLMIQKLEIVESSAYDCIETFITYFSCFYFIKLVACQVAFLNKLRFVYDDFLSLQTLLLFSLFQIKPL